MVSIVGLVGLERYCRPLHEESTHCPDNSHPSLKNVPSWRAPLFSCFGSFSLCALPWPARGPNARFWRRGSPPYPIQKSSKSLPPPGPFLPLPSLPPEKRPLDGRSTLFSPL